LVLELNPELASGFAAIIPLSGHLAMLPTIDQRDSPAGDNDEVVSGICVLCKTEHLRIIAEAVLVCGVGHDSRVGVPGRPA